MTVIAIPPGHDHLADALVRDLGFIKAHVDDPVRQMALAIDPIVEAGVQLANMGRSPRLSARLETSGGDWVRAAARAPEITRLLDALRPFAPDEPGGDLVVTDVTDLDHAPLFAVYVAIEGRAEHAAHVIAEGDVATQQTAIVELVRALEGEEAPSPFPAGDVPTGEAITANFGGAVKVVAGPTIERLSDQADED